MTLLPWRQVIVPHKDVLEGTFQEASFAADLTKVVRGLAPPEYQDPVLFFERTLITEGMSLLLQSVLRRLAGLAGDPVIQLQTAFGGGKTHTMMAVLHVASGKVPPKKMRGVSELLDRAKVKELQPARLAILDGNALAPAQPRRYGPIEARTLWGELAYQLGHEDGYHLIADSDREGTSPGKAVLAELLGRFSPVVILMDETVAYLRQFERGRSYAGGTYNSNLSFLQALTEAASTVKGAMVLASLPESEMEAGDGDGQQVLDAVQKIFGRIEAVWKPVGTDEAFEIVRRRLFGEVHDEAARNATCRAFAELYIQEKDKFPAESREAGYARRLEASYPIHPEVFARLYEDWSTQSKFQRTRGVLRLMARLVHSLWRADNRDLLILPGSIPLDDSAVRNELVKYLPAGWDPIVDKDVDGPNAEPRRIDDSTPALGSVQACRRAARTIFLGSAPSVAAQKVRGLGIERVRLGCAEPGKSTGKYDDALRRLGDRLHYLYSENERYWFDLRPNLRREMEDRVRRFSDPGLHLYPEIQDRLKSAVKTKVCTAVHVFTESKDIPNKIELRVVVLSPDHGHKRKDEASKAIQAAEDILANFGDRKRDYQNRLLFLAPEAGSVSTLCTQVQRFLAWKSICDDRDVLNLDKHHEKEAAKSRDEAHKRVEASLRETYRFLLVPMQDAAEGETPGSIQWEDEVLSLSGSSYDKAVELATKEREWVIQGWAPAHLGDILRKWFWKTDRKAVSMRKVWQDLCKYLYLPRLLSEEVFLQTVRAGLASRDWFAYAAREKSPGIYEGLVFGTGGQVYLDESSLLVHPDAAEKAHAADKPAGVNDRVMIDCGPPESGQQTLPIGRKPEGSNVPSSPKRFHGSVTIPTDDPMGAFIQVVENVIEFFTADIDSQVTLTLDIEARRKGGFNTKTVRIVKENANTLKFLSADFEDE